MKKIYSERFKWFDEQYEPDQYLDIYHGGDFSEFVISMGGDVSRYRVYGQNPKEFKCYCK